MVFVFIYFSLVILFRNSTILKRKLLLYIIAYIKIEINKKKHNMKFLQFCKTPLKFEAAYLKSLVSITIIRHSSSRHLHIVTTQEEQDSITTEA